jgi:hypothetical protein
MLVRTRELFDCVFQASPEGEPSSSLKKSEREMNDRDWRDGASQLIDTSPPP